MKIIGGFPIEIKTKISKISYFGFNLISFGNPPIVYIFLNPLRLFNLRGLWMIGWSLSVSKEFL